MNIIRVKYFFKEAVIATNILIDSLYERYKEIGNIEGVQIYIGKKVKHLYNTL